LKNEPCTFEVAEDGTVRLSGELTFESVPMLYGEMERRLPAAGPVTTIDLARVTAADSAGLALLLEWQSRQRQRGRELTMRGAPSNLLHLAGLCEAIELLNLSGRDGEA
jgi:phospholipid transport system transporter-binding protein